MNREVDISIIIPVYQSEPYILNCLESIAQQTYRDFEIILVDDGSTDNSIAVAEAFLHDKELSYSVIRQNNKGAAAARNAGVRAANGKRIVFVDSDDHLTKRYLEQLVLAADSTGLKVSIVNFKYVNESSISSEPETMEPVQHICKDRVLHDFLIRKINIVVTAILIDKDEFIARDLWFDETVRFGEDAIFYWRLLMSQEEIAYNYTPLYNYFIHEGSATTAPSKERIRTNIIGFQRLYEEINNNLGTEFADKVIARQYFAVLRIYALYMTYEEYLEIYELLDINRHLKTLCAFPDIRVRLLSNSLKVSKKLFYFVNKKRGA